MKKLLVTVALLIVGFDANAITGGNLNVQRRDMKLATQQLIERLALTAPLDVTTGSTRLLNQNTADTAGAATTISSFLAQPDFARSISVIPMGSTGDVKAGTVVVNGTDLQGSTIAENFTFVAGQSSPIEGNKAFNTVTSIVFPAENAPYKANWSVGLGSKLGLHRCMDIKGDHIQSTLDGTKESTEPTVTADATTLSNNTVKLNSLLNNKDVQIFFMQNFRCAP